MNRYNCVAAGILRIDVARNLILSRQGTSLGWGSNECTVCRFGMIFHIGMHSVTWRKKRVSVKKRAFGREKTLNVHENTVKNVKMISVFLGSQTCRSLTFA